MCADPWNIITQGVTLLHCVLWLEHLRIHVPGIINGGVISALFDCHGNWTAAIALMDKAKLPRPPLTLTAELLVRHTILWKLSLSEVLAWLYT